MALPPRYERAIGLEGSPSLISPEVGNSFDPIGEAVEGIGQQLEQSQRPRLIREAQEKAVRDALTLPIVRDPATGNLIATPINPTGGEPYVRALREAYRARQVGEISADAQSRFDRIAAEHHMDPDGALTNMQAAADGIMAGLEPEVGFEVEMNLLREIGERHRGISYRRAAEDWQANVNGLRIYREGLAAKAAELWLLGTPEAATEAQRLEREIESVHNRELDLGTTTREGVIGHALDYSVRVGRVRDEGHSRASMRRMLEDVQKLPIEEARVLSFWLQGIDVPNGPEEINGITFRMLDELFPGQDGMAYRRQTASGFAGRVSDHDQEQRRLEDIARAEATAQADRQALAGALSRAMQGDRTYSAEEEAAMDQSFLSTMGLPDGTNPDAYMTSPQGQAHTQNFLAQTGYLPAQVRNWLKTRVYSDQVLQTVAFMTTLRDTRDNQGVDVGLMAFARLDEETRGVYDLVTSLQRTETQSEDIVVQVRQFLRGERPAVTDVAPLYSGRPGGLDGARRRVASTAIGPNLPGVLPPAFSADLQQAMLRHARSSSDPATIERDAALDLGRRWIHDPIFVGGIGPRAFIDRFRSLGMSGNILNTAFLQGQPRVPAGTAFNNPRAAYSARLEPADTAPAGRLGRFYVRVYHGQSTRVVHSYMIDADEALRPFIIGGSAIQPAFGVGQRAVERGNYRTPAQRRRERPGLPIPRGNRG